MEQTNLTLRERMIARHTISRKYRSGIKGEYVPVYDISAKNIKILSPRNIFILPKDPKICMAEITKTHFKYFGRPVRLTTGR